MLLFDQLKNISQHYLTELQIQALFSAYVLADEAHQNQLRATGEPYIAHPVAVTCILAEMRLDLETLQAALLHDVIEDCDITKEEISAQFGETVANLVDGVSKLDKLKFRDRKEAQAANFHKMVLAMVQDIRVILIKLADRTHNMRTIDALRHNKRKRIANETLEIYAPLAHRLGIYDIKNELEELSFKALYPNRYQVLKRVLADTSGNRNTIINQIQTEINDKVTKAGLTTKISGRRKNLFSIYNKMKDKKLGFHHIMDLYAFHIVVATVDECYRVLGQVHSLYKPRPGCIKDYIAVPKANGYQSLHTSMIGPCGIPIEIQIRTEHMDQMADKGVAAHWSYKGKKDKFNDTTQIKVQLWMQSLLEIQQYAGNSFEFIENVKADLFPDEIYVFTPKGRIVELPLGATAIDFAYALHTDIGNTCTGVRVNDQAYPLSQPLKSGQTVEIIKTKDARPNAAWLNYVVTSQARSKIRQFLKNTKREESIALGKQLLTHALGYKPIESISFEKIKLVLTEQKLDSLNDLLAAVGLGKVMSHLIAKRLTSDNIDLTSSEQTLSINGSEGLLITFATCCHPIPDDHIVAHISPGKGLVVHREVCANIRGYPKYPEKYMAITWAKEQNRHFLAKLTIEMLNKQGALTKLTGAISNAKAHLKSLSTKELDGSLYNIKITLTVKNRIHLAHIMRKIKMIPETAAIWRRKN